jgi:hypothetical protein
MGYQTVKQVPSFYNYEAAKMWWERTKPIKGRSVDIRPLAERRYADCYSIRKNPRRTPDGTRSARTSTRAR